VIIPHHETFRTPHAVIPTTQPPYSATKG
jgi:hypothetical protein